MKARTKKLTALLLAVAATLSLALSGCGNASDKQDGGQSVSENASESANQTDGSVIHVGIAQDLTSSLDPHQAEGAGAREVLFNVFEGLYKPDSEGNFIPAVAETYELSEDKLVYTFTLRSDVKFHNGDTVTVEDVKTSIEDCMTNQDSPAYIPAFANIASVETPDEKTVVIALSEADPDFMSYLASVKAAIVPADSEDLDTNPIGTGPYQYVSRSIQENIILEKFEDYWGKKANIDRVVFKVCADSDSVTTSLKSGSIDMMAHLTATQVAQLGDEFNIVENTMNLVQALYLNNDFEPFQNEAVRQALCYAVDRQQILELVSDGKGAIVGSSMFPNFKKYFDESLNDIYSYDPQRAKELLKEAGYENGFSFKITVPSNYTQHVDTAQVIVEQLKAVGIDAQIHQVEWNTWLEEVYTNRNYEATVVGVDASYLAASAMLSRFRSDSSSNFVNYKNADYDVAYAAARAEISDEKQTEYYKACQRILAETAANVYIQDLPEMVALSNRFTGYECYPLYVQDIANIKLAE
ncbi:MAG: ABC transporter substrate-binding protein [Roseburia sp.]